MTPEMAINTGDYTVRLIARTVYDLSPAPRIYVADEVAQARSADLADLKQQEQELGERRFADRGVYSDVDALYDRLNTEIMRVKTVIAREVLASLHLTVDGDVDAAIDQAFFSRKAGCDRCPCTPGVIAGTGLLWQGGEFDVWVEVL